MRDSGQCVQCVFGVILCSGQFLPMRYTQVQVAPVGSATNHINVGIPDIRFTRKTWASPEQLTRWHLVAKVELVMTGFPHCFGHSEAHFRRLIQNLTLLIVYLVHPVSLA